MAKDNTFSGMAHNALTAETTIVGKIVSQKDIRIDGTLEGRLECQGKVVIGETGQVIGDIVARRLAIEPGAVLNGKCTMLQQLDDGGDA